jgi:dihydrofolate reductase
MKVPPMPEIIIIAAVARNRAIGKNNQLLWNIPEDMAHFKALTQGHAVLMGRKTWESLPERFRPLPGRRNIVITRQSDYAAPGAILASSIEQGIAAAQNAEKLFIIGGSEIYAQCLNWANSLELTEIDASPEGDAYFPDFSEEKWRTVCRKPLIASALPSAFVRYERI